MHTTQAGLLEIQRWYSYSFRQTAIPSNRKTSEQENILSDDAEKGASQTGENGAAATEQARKKRKARTPEEILKEIEADEQEQINRIKARAAERKAAVTVKVSASAKKELALTLLSKLRASIKGKAGNADLTDEAADAELTRIVYEHVGATSAGADAGASGAAAAGEPAGEPAQPAMAG